MFTSLSCASTAIFRSGITYSLAFLLVAWASPLFAQLPVAPSVGSKSEERSSDRAEALYQDLGYKAAIPLYESKSSLTRAQMVQLATSYRLNHDTENAELWYAQVVAQGDSSATTDPEHLLYYAQALQSNGRAAQAQGYFERYDALRGGEDARGQAFAKTYSATLGEAAVTVRNEQAMNTPHLDFSPALFGEELVFVSTRPQGRLDRDGKDLWIDDNFMSLWTSARVAGSETLAVPVTFAPELNTQFHEGPLCFDASGERIYFTRNTFNKGKRRNSSDGVMKLNLYTAYMTEQGWSEPTELPFNTDDYEEAHPALSADGQTLYFASNRPGGQGGMDLYKSSFVQGVWSAPVNLGPQVNTAGNEVFPFVQVDGMLTYASDGLGGLGGLDLFQLPGAVLGGVGEPALVSSLPQNLGAPYNSEKDDFGFVATANGLSGYFTSARNGGLGKDDIYSFRVAGEAVLPVLQTICVTRAGEVGDRLAGVQVQVEEVLATADESNDGDLKMQLRQIGSSEDYELTFRQGATAQVGASAARTRTTDEDGTVQVSLLPGRLYRITAEQGGFESGSQLLDLRSGRGSQAPCLALQPQVANGVSTTSLAAAGPSVMLKGVTRNARYDKLLGDVELRLINLCTGEELSGRSDASGNFSFGCVPCGCEFVIRGAKAHFAAAEMLASTLGVACGEVNCAAGGAVTVTLAMLPQLPGSPGAGLVAGLNSLPGTIVPSAGTPRAPSTLGGAALEAGAVIELKNIYYDFDQSFIRADARPDLEAVVALMREYPGLTIELGSHTDARATLAYNVALSQRRAEAARAFLVQAGIDGRRVTARGFGESQLRNRCVDGVTCNATEHQYNRRTEIRIVSMGELVGAVRYRDNAPEVIDGRDPAGR